MNRPSNRPCTSTRSAACRDAAAPRAVVAYVRSATASLTWPPNSGRLRQQRREDHAGSDEPAEPRVLDRINDLRTGNPADRQLARILDVAATQHLTLPEDLIFSDAPAPEHTRPGRAALVAYCESHPQPTARSGLILVTNYDRLGRFRDPRQLWGLELRLQNAGWDLTPLDRPFGRAVSAGGAVAGTEAAAAARLISRHVLSVHPNAAPSAQRRAAQRQAAQRRAAQRRNTP